jgi:hypothetical protein
MRSEVLERVQPRGLRPSRRTIVLLLLAVAALIAMFALIGAPHLLMPSGSGGKGLGDLEKALQKIEGPALAVFGTLSFLGLVAGGGMAAMGMQQGMRIMVTAGLAGGGILLGKGLIA